MTISAYEKQRLENIKQNQEQLKMLGLAEIPSRKPQSVKRKTAEERKTAEPGEPTRKSLRVQGINPDGQVKNEEPMVLSDVEDPLIHGTISVSDAKNLYPTEAEDLEIKPNQYRDLKLFDQESAKVMSDMVYSLTVHPSQEKLICAIGDKQGNLAFWNLQKAIEGDNEIHSFKPHKKSISNLYFDSNYLQNTYISSYDGSLRKMDIISETIDQVCVLEDGITSFKIDQGVMWCSTFAGSVISFDLRKAQDLQFYTASEKKINTIDKYGNYVVTAGLDRTIKLHDDRKFAEPIKVFEHNKSVNSAYFDPVGQHILSTSFDDTIKIWDMNGKNISIQHNNKTGKWTHKFRATYNNNKEDGAFVIGNMKRSINVFSNKGEILAVLDAPSIPAVCAFHPSIDLIVAGNSSGRMLIYQ